MRGMGVGMLCALLPALASAGDLPQVQRELGEVVVPGAGRALLQGGRGEELIEYGMLPPIEPPRITAEEALRIAQAFSGLTGAAATAEAMAFPEERGAEEKRKVWRQGYAVDLVTRSPPAALRVLVDGRGWPRGMVQLHNEGSAFVFERSPSHGDLQEVPLEGLVEEHLLDGDGFRVRGCSPANQTACELAALASPDAAGDWFYLPSLSDPLDPFAEVNTFWHLAEARGELAAIGLDSYPRDVQAVVNFRMDLDGDGLLDPFPNALYVPELFGSADGLVFGFTGQGSMAHDADVVRHELVHAATVHLAELVPTLDEHGWNHQPAVVAEALADYFAATISGDPTIGVHAGLLLGQGDGGIRRLDQEMSCSGDFVGLVHEDSLILSGALWEARETLGPEMDRVVAAGLRAMPLHPSLSQASEAILAAAGVHLGGASHQRLEEIFSLRDIPSCSRFREIFDDEAVLGTLPVTHQMAGLSPGPFQYRYRVPDRSGRVTVSLQILDGEEGEQGVVYARLGAPVTYTARSMGDRYWLEVSFDAEGKGEIVLTSDWWALYDEPVLFISPANSSSSRLTYSISVSSSKRVFEPDVLEGEDEEQEEVPEQPLREPPEPDQPCCLFGAPALLLALLLLPRGCRRRRKRPGPG